MHHPRILLRLAAGAVLGLAVAAPAYPAEATNTPTPTPDPVSTLTATSPPPPDPAGRSVAPDPAGAPVSPARESGGPAPGGADPGGEDGEIRRRGLPVTGAQVGGMVVLGGGLIAAGIAMVAVRRRDPSSLDGLDA